MTALADLARSLGERPRAVTLFGVPEGYDAAAVGALFAQGRVRYWLHVCRDDGRMARFGAALAFFHPELEALLDCADADIFDWIAGRAIPPPAYDHDVTRLLLAYSNTRPTK